MTRFRKRLEKSLSSKYITVADWGKTLALLGLPFTEVNDDDKHRTPFISRVVTSYIDNESHDWELHTTEVHLEKPEDILAISFDGEEVFPSDRVTRLDTKLPIGPHMARLIETCQRHMDSLSEASALLGALQDFQRRVYGEEVARRFRWNKLTSLSTSGVSNDSAYE